MHAREKEERGKERRMCDNERHDSDDSVIERREATTQARVLSVRK